MAIRVRNREGEMITPSGVLIEPGSAVVGGAALDVSLEQPDKVATLIKRRMGYPNFDRPVAGREFRPETLSALILRKLVQDAESRIGPISKAVITVPAYFDDTRRKATKDAGRIAGLDVLDILDEPTAAALAYSFQPPRSTGDLNPDHVLPGEQRTVLVYDLRGGTVDHAAGAPPGRLGLGPGGPRAPGRRLDPHGDDRPDAARNQRQEAGQLHGGQRGGGPRRCHPRRHRRLAQRRNRLNA